MHPVITEDISVEEFRDLRLWPGPGNFAIDEGLLGRPRIKIIKLKNFERDANLGYLAAGCAFNKKGDIVVIGYYSRDNQTVLRQRRLYRSNAEIPEAFPKVFTVDINGRAQEERITGGIAYIERQNLRHRVAREIARYTELRKLLEK